MCVCIQTEGTECVCVCVCVYVYREREVSVCVYRQRELNVYVYRHSCSNEGSHFVSLVRWVILEPYFLLLLVVRAKRLIDTRTHTQTRDGAAKYSRPTPPPLPSFLIVNDSLSSCVQFLGPFAKSRKCRLPSSCQPVRLFAYVVSASTGRICMKSCIGYVY